MLSLMRGCAGAGTAAGWRGPSVGVTYARLHWGGWAVRGGRLDVLLQAGPAARAGSDSLSCSSSGSAVHTWKLTTRKACLAGAKHPLNTPLSLHLSLCSLRTRRGRWCLSGTAPLTPTSTSPPTGRASTSCASLPRVSGRTAASSCPCFPFSLYWAALSCLLSYPARAVCHEKCCGCARLFLCAVP